MTLLTDARSTIAALFVGGPYDLQYDVPDAVHPPTLFVVEAVNHLTPRNFCAWLGSYEVVAVAGRISPGAGMDLLDDMVSYVLGALAGARFMTGDIGGAVRLDIGGVPYLAKRIPVSLPVTIPTVGV